MPTAPATPTLPQVSFVNLYSEDPWKKRQRVRIQQACSECRRQKIKCDGQKPCKSCKKSDRSCIYNASAGSKDDHDHHNSSSTSAHDDHAPATTTAAATTASTTATTAKSTPEAASTPASNSSSAESSQASTPDSKHHKSHDHHDNNNNSSSNKTKIQVKDIGKYGIPLDEWQKQDDSTLHTSRKN
ncbi:hypothetical protein BGZ97_009229, partial [Linnemannia gamsii]